MPTSLPLASKPISGSSKAGKPSIINGVNLKPPAYFHLDANLSYLLLIQGLLASEWYS